ncbi:outer membrane protein assembly factor BamB [Pseudidiomarina taiwanensis]|uniref:Outer membrane protein assembly factor BamB n=1 Tax=Pseudidiomarina taiwanensis TaxID=337250 RepID=A0A432ZKT2_9GAMM|nr:outer membrane protein assembly factor BamB [Pseudidiomarina taiwanensis]RUO78440.1 outer membrane protein assembly factor BamB [Pseudidiomarina taiwanensis]
MKLTSFVRYSLIAASLSLVSGCSLLGYSDDEKTYKELQPLTTSVPANILWQGEVGDGVGSFFSRLHPVKVKDYVIAADRAGEVRAMNAATGALVWQIDVRELLGSEGDGWIFPSEPFRIAGGLSTNPSQTQVYLGSENGTLLALNAEDGSLFWQASVDGEVLTDPVVSDGIVVLNTGSGTIVALSEQTGEEIWTLGTDVPALSLRGTGAPAVTNGGVLFGTANGKLKVAVLDNGQEAWEARLAVPQGATELQRLVDSDVQPIISGTAAYSIAYNGQLSAVELRSGRILWQREYSSYRDMSYTLGRLYLTDSQDSVYAVDVNGGIELWSNDDFQGRSVTEPVRFGDYIVVGDRFGFLHFLAAGSGENVGRLELDSEIYTAPIVAGDTMYLQLRDGSVLALGL